MFCEQRSIAMSCDRELITNKTTFHHALGTSLHLWLYLNSVQISKSKIYEMLNSEMSPSRSRVPESIYKIQRHPIILVGHVFVRIFLYISMIILKCV